MRISSYFQIWRHRYTWVFKPLRFKVLWFIESWFWWKPRRITKEFWKYGYVLSWDERTNLGGVQKRRWARYIDHFARWQHNRRLGYCCCRRCRKYTSEVIRGRGRYKLQDHHIKSLTDGDITRLSWSTMDKTGRVESFDIDLIPPQKWWGVK